MPVTPELLDEHIAAIRDRRGEESIHRGDEQSPVNRIAIPIPSLMRITGGGIPLGRITRLWGDPSTSKTLVSLMIIAAAQRHKTTLHPKGLETAYWNVEKVWDEAHARNLGVDTKRMLLEEVTTIEEIAREMELLLLSCHVHVIDSASSAICVDELATNEDDWTRALDARAWKRAIRRIHARLDKEENALIIIDHSSRDQVTKQEFARGGKSLEYGSSMSLHFKKGSWLYYHPKTGHLDLAEKIKGEMGESPSGQKEADGAEVIVRVNKSRVCRPFRVARLRLDLNTFKFDTTFELLDSAQFFDINGGVAIRSGKPAIAQRTGAKSSWFQLPDGEKVQGEVGIRQRIEGDPKLAKLIMSAMLAGN